MATLSVKTVCSYLTDTDVQWRQDDWTANKMVKILKGESFEGYFDLTVEGERRQFTKRNAASFLPIVHMILADVAQGIARKGAALVPIPNSDVTKPDDEDFKTRTLAEGIISHLSDSFSVVPALVFRTVMQKSRQGGSRDPTILEKAMLFGARPSEPIILVDDVLTTGGHFIAAARKLRAEGLNVLAGVAFAKATKEQTPKVLSVVTTELDLDPVPFDFSKLL